MNILRRFNSISSSSTSSSSTGVLSSIDKLILRVRNEQVRNSGTLLKCIDLLIDKYQSLLIKKFNINYNELNQYKIQQEIWDNLKRMKLEFKDTNKLLRKKLMINNQVEYTKEYRNFIKQLYPINNNITRRGRRIFDSEIKYFDLVNNSKKYLNINHDELFKRYLDLPSPAPRYMNHEDLENFINKFLLRRKNYADSNQIEGCIIKEDYQAAIKSIIRKNEDRKNYHDICIKIINDINKSNLPVTRNEQIRLIYLSYFKDRQDLIKYIDDENKIMNENLNYPEFNWNDYSKLLKLFDDRDDILGILLFLATRHDKFDIIQDILPRVGLNEIININNNSNTILDIKLKDVSLIHLLVYFTYYIKRPNYETYLTNTIDYITENVSILGTDMINTIINSLIQLGHIKKAQMLFEMAFCQDVSSSSQPQDSNNSENMLYRRFTSEDDQVFKDWLSIYSNLKKITQDQEIIYKLIPNDTSFMIFIDGYCKYGEFSQIKQMIYIMDNLINQPLSTRMYTRIFTGFMKRTNESGWILDEFIEVLTRLIRDIDNKERTPGYLKKLINDGSVITFSQTRSSLMEQKQQLQYQNFENINILRLSNLLLETIINALESLLHHNSMDQPKYKDALTNLRDVLEKREIMLENQHRKARSVYYADRLEHINRAVLFEVFSIVSRL